MIDGLLGRHRLTVRSSGNWFTQSAALENGTDILNGPVNLEPGKTYGNVRIWLSDETAEIEGLMPEGWSADSHSMIMAFPEDMSLWQDRGRYIQSGTVSATDTPLFREADPSWTHVSCRPLHLRRPRRPTRRNPRTSSETLNELWPRATRIFIGEAGKFEVTLPPLSRDR